MARQTDNSGPQCQLSTVICSDKFFDEILDYRSSILAGATCFDHREPMNKTIRRLTWMFISAFAFSCAAVVLYQVYYIIPRDRCEAAGHWWDPQSRICGVPITLSTLTGRKDKNAPKIEAKKP